MRSGSRSKPPPAHLRYTIGDRAAEVQINRRDWMLLQLVRGAHEGRDVVADHLRDDRPAGWILRDGLSEDLRVESRRRAGRGSIP